MNQKTGWVGRCFAVGSALSRSIPNDSVRAIKHSASSFSKNSGIPIKLKVFVSCFRNETKMESMKAGRHTSQNRGICCDDHLVGVITSCASSGTMLVKLSKVSPYSVLWRENRSEANAWTEVPFTGVHCPKCRWKLQVLHLLECERHLAWARYHDYAFTMMAHAWSWKWLY